MYHMGTHEQMEHLHELFPLTCIASIPTSGVQHGRVLKFKTFYLKIYEQGINGDFNIQGYLYNKQNPMFIDEVSSNQLRSYAAQFTSDDYLESMIKLHASRA